MPSYLAARMAVIEAAGMPESSVQTPVSRGSTLKTDRTMNTTAGMKISLMKL